MKKLPIVALAFLGTGLITSCQGKNNTSSTTSLTKPVEKMVQGSFSYMSTNGTSTTNYGTAVKLYYIEETKKISIISRDEKEIADKKLVEATNIVIENTWDGEAIFKKYLANIQKVFNTYIGMKYEDAYKKIKENIKPSYTSAEKDGVSFEVNEDFKKSDMFMVTTGATQTSSRLALAILNAISNISLTDNLDSVDIADHE